MYQPYRDILRRLGKPLWWDENGVPRYDPFHPLLTADIYADFRALIEIRCQGCERVFPVASVWGIGSVVASRENWKELIVWDETGHNPRPKEGLPKHNDPGFCGYGDAPFHDFAGGFDGQCSGTTMTTAVVRIVEFWQRSKDYLDWERNPAHEVYVGEDEEQGASTSTEEE